MLRILVFDEPFSVKLRLEGELTDTTTAQLTQRWGEVRDRLRNRIAILDLGDVAKVDEAGRGMLGELADAGVRISYAHPALQPIIKRFELPAAPLFYIYEKSIEFDAPPCSVPAGVRGAASPIPSLRMSQPLIGSRPAAFSGLR